MSHVPFIVALNSKSRVRPNIGSTQKKCPLYTYPHFYVENFSRVNGIMLNFGEKWIFIFIVDGEDIKIHKNVKESVVTISEWAEFFFEVTFALS